MVSAERREGWSRGCVVRIGLSELVHARWVADMRGDQQNRCRGKRRVIDTRLAF